MTYLEIIDTSVKVGLGALISGLTVYFTSRKSHSHELNLNRINSKKEMVMQCVSKINKSTSLFYTALQNIYSVCYANEFFSLIHFNEEFENMIKALDNSRDARSLAYLAGEKELGDLIGKSIDLIIERSYHIQDNKDKYDVKFVNAKNEEAGELGEKILIIYGGIFEKTYKKKYS
jgi:hypothetical protein